VKMIPDRLCSNCSSKMTKTVIALLILLSSLPVAGQDRIAAGTAWSQPFFTRIDATFSSDVFHARWDISRCACGDMHIRAEETLPGEIRKGEQLLVDHSVLLVRGYESHQGDLSSLLDSPVLIMQLLFILLQKAEPGGPAAVTANLEAEISEPKLHLELDTGIAFGLFPAPWSVAGTIGPRVQGRITFDLRFEFTVHQQDQEPGQSQVLLNGFLDYVEQPFPVDESEILDGWKLDWLQSSEEGQPELNPGVSLGQFRASIN